MSDVRLRCKSKFATLWLMQQEPLDRSSDVNALIESLRVEIQQLRQRLAELEEKHQRELELCRVVTLCRNIAYSLRVPYAHPLADDPEFIAPDTRRPVVTRSMPARLSRITRTSSAAICVKWGLPAQSPTAHTPAAVVRGRSSTLMKPRSSRSIPAVSWPMPSEFGSGRSQPRGPIPRTRCASRAALRTRRIAPPRAQRAWPSAPRSPRRRRVPAGPQSRRGPRGEPGRRSDRRPSPGYRAPPRRIPRDARSLSPFELIPRVNFLPWRRRFRSRPETQAARAGKRHGA